MSFIISRCILITSAATLTLCCEAVRYARQPTPPLSSPVSPISSVSQLGQLLNESRSLHIKIQEIEEQKQALNHDYENIRSHIVSLSTKTEIDGWEVDGYIQSEFAKSSVFPQLSSQLNSPMADLFSVMSGIRSKMMTVTEDLYHQIEMKNKLDERIELMLWNRSKRRKRRKHRMHDHTESSDKGWQQMLNQIDSYKKDLVKYPELMREATFLQDKIELMRPSDPLYDVYVNTQKVRISDMKTLEARLMTAYGGFDREIPPKRWASGPRCRTLSACS